MSAPRDPSLAAPPGDGPVAETLAYGAREAGQGPAGATAETLLVPSAPSQAPPRATAPLPKGDPASGAAQAETMLSLEPGTPPPGTPRAPGSQTTVLPQISLQGDQPRFTHDPRQRYEIVGALGEGGIGEVWEAWDHDISRRVALKRLRAEVDSPEALARFVEEIRTTGGLEHPNIVPIHDVGADDQGRYYFVMKHVDGETLEAVLTRLRAGDAETHQRYGFQRRVELFKAVLEAIAYAHSRGYIHRDIKPANIMVGAFGEVLVMDWGIARPLRGAEPILEAALRATPQPPRDTGDRPFATQVGALIGTPAYMAPEQARGEAVDERSDVYSLSVLLHELLTLRHYLADQGTVAETLVGVLETPVPHASFVKHPHQGAVPADLGWFIAGGIAKDPSARYPSVVAMLERLERRAEGDIPVQCPMTALRATANWGLRLLDRRPLLALGMVTLSALAVLGGAALAVARLL